MKHRFLEGAAKDLSCDSLKVLGISRIGSIVEVEELQCPGCKCYLKPGSEANLDVVRLSIHGFICCKINNQCLAAGKRGIGTLKLVFLTVDFYYFRCYNISAKQNKPETHQRSQSITAHFVIVPAK